MPDLILRPSGLDDPKRAWALQLRYHESVGETAYRTLCRISEDTAHEIIKAGAAGWLFGEPPTSTAGEDEPSEGEIALGTRVTCEDDDGEGIVCFYDRDKNKYAVRWDDDPESGKRAFWSREELTVLADPVRPEPEGHIKEAIENVVRAHGRAEELVRDLGDARHFLESAVLPLPPESVPYDTRDAEDRRDAALSRARRPEPQGESVMRSALERIAAGREVRMPDGTTEVKDLDDAAEIARAALADTREG